MEPLSEGLLRRLITALCKSQQAYLALGQLSVLSEVGFVPSSLTKQVLEITTFLPGPFTTLWLLP
jgi:hypothetical protein